MTDYKEELKSRMIAEMAVIRERMRKAGIRVDDLHKIIHRNTFSNWRSGLTRDYVKYQEVLHYIEGKEND